MTTTAEMTAFDRCVRPVVEEVFRERAQVVLDYRPSAEFQARVEELAARSTEGKLTEAERAEYAGYVRANKFVAILQRLAREVSKAA
jgi:hypothetical protein